MGDIENPWHSRPIDVHRWSDHAEVAGLCDRIWDGYRASYDADMRSDKLMLYVQTTTLTLRELFDVKCLKSC